MVVAIRRRVAPAPCNVNDRDNGSAEDKEHRDRETPPPEDEETETPNEETQEEEVIDGEQPDEEQPDDETPDEEPLNNDLKESLEALKKLRERQRQEMEARVAEIGAKLGTKPEAPKPKQTKYAYDRKDPEGHWNRRYEKLKEFKEKHGTCAVPPNYPPDKWLAGWASKQRVQYKSSKLDQRRIDLLNEIGFVWEPDLHPDWSVMYDKLVEYKAEFGNCLVPYTSKIHRALGFWVSRQRESYNKNKLSADKLNLLNEIDFSWDPYSEQWTKRYQLLKEYKDKHGDCNYPLRGGGPDLPGWVKNQREKFRKGLLSQERIGLLEEIGFQWQTMPKEDSSERRWNEMYLPLKKYKEEHGHCNIPKEDTEHSECRRWLGSQRTSYKKNSLSQKHMRDLESLGVISDTVRDNNWQKNYRLLKDYYQKNGNPPEQSRLGRWIESQHMDYKSRALSEERINLLRQTGIVFYDDDYSDVSLNAMEFVDEPDDDMSDDKVELVAQEQVSILRELLNRSREENMALAEEIKRKDEENKQKDEEIQRLVDENRQLKISSEQMYLD